MQRKIRVLVGKPGLDGHDRGAKVVAAALRDAGMEVIYTGLHQSPAQVVEAAVQEDVDVVALSILSGAHMTLFPEVLELMRERGIGDRLLTGGGIIPPEDMESLAKLGVGRLFGPGASTQDIARYIHDWFVEQHGAASLPAPVAVRAATRSGPTVAEALHHARPGRSAAAGKPVAAGKSATAGKPAAAGKSVAAGRSVAAGKRATGGKRAAAAAPKRAGAARKGAPAKRRRPARAGSGVARRRK